MPFKRKKEKWPVGAPPKYRTPEEMEKAINAYFAGGAYKRKVVTALGQTIEIPTPTITDLVMYLGFVDRHSFYAYEEKPEFSNTIKRARNLIEREYENMLRQQACTGAIFALKNFGWIDRREIEQKVQMHIQIKHEDVEERLNCFLPN